ncbi:hypothetical protein ONR75_18460 [Rhodopseudomonas sp. P2A-2r]|uniref:hypothetical protein n=1 Tax=Rhodopseudomonas sp. P2A-2r TaxID=2991972 RepID=UPI002234DB43|nr:hypothetical protein [Rhodopseudomonas sp. P2A-2r]UZE46988.1 hypothetical protein ONR75_18460 [Rhodopseudomonas sp. P2A-2r]
MTDSIETNLKTKEFELKLIQAWSDSHYKIATMALLGNGAALATTVASIRDKGHDSPSVFALHSSALGLVSGGAAVFLIWVLSETAISKVIKSGADENASNVAVLAHPLISLLLFILVAGSACGFMGGIAFYEGWSDAIMTFRSK